MLRIRYIKRNQEVYRSYEQIKRMGIGFFETYYKGYTSIPQETKLSCICSPAGVKMLIAYRKETTTYTLRSFPNQKARHRESCLFHGLEGLSASRLDTGHTINQDLRTFATELLHQSWNALAAKLNAEKPTIDLLFQQLAKTISGHVPYGPQGKPLKEKLYAGGSTGQIHKLEKTTGNDAEPFVLTSLVTERVNGKTIFLTTRHPNKEMETVFQVNRAEYEKERGKLFGENLDVLVAGTAESRGFGKAPELTEFCLLPHSNGLPVLSRNEKKLVDLLVEKQRKFLRPTTADSVKEWQGWLPTVMLLDAERPFVMMVFPEQKSAHSRLEKREAIKHFYKMTGSGFWYTDGASDSLPLLPKRKQ